MRNKIGLGALAVGCAFSFGLLASEREAHAYCRTTTENCSSGCCTKGKPLYWKNICVGFSLQKDGTKQIPFESMRTIVEGAFGKWTNITCPATGQRVSLDFRNIGDVTCTEVRYNKDAPNQNVIVFRDSKWDHTDNANTLGLTTVVFDPGSGEIFDADMEINTAQQVLSYTTVVPPQGYDFESIVTHEAGHFLGLAHSGDPKATMTAHYNPGTPNGTTDGQNMRDLADDDIAGVCSIYLAKDDQPAAPNGRRATVDGGAVAAGACDTTPRHGFSPECNASSNDKGCAVSSGAFGSSGNSGNSGSSGAEGEDGGSKAGMFAAFGMLLTVAVARRKSLTQRLLPSPSPRK